MKVLTMGTGAREHVIVWKIKQQNPGIKQYVASGNAGTGLTGTNVLLEATDVSEFVTFAKANIIDFTIACSEYWLEAGIVNAFQEAGLLIFGPTREAAEIETKKDVAKELMQRYGIPTASAFVANSIDEARVYLQDYPVPVMLKPAGLTGGHGVKTAFTKVEAQCLAIEMMKAWPGQKILIEECLVGSQVSVVAFVYHDKVSELFVACGYKRLGEGDTGSNTEGIGAYSPPSFWTPDLDQQVRETIMEPVTRALVSRSTPFVGMLCAELMLTKKGPKVLEFNAAPGSPEIEVILQRMESDFLKAMMLTVTGRVDEISLQWKKETSVAVVLASPGYPENPETGYVIEGLDDLDHRIFHGATLWEGDDVIAGGGRLLTVVACELTLEKTLRAVYGTVRKLIEKNPRILYREDIARLV